MKQTVNFSDFCDAFTQFGRQDQYTYAGKRALFEYLEQYEEDCGTEIELDVIALCREYTEYSSAADCIIECGYSECDLTDEGMDDDEKEEIALEWLRDQTQVIEFNGGIIICDF
jgi:hypothetical protein